MRTPSSPRFAALAPLVLLAALAGGCSHVTTKVPGVLDLRSDGALAPLEKEPPKGQRDGFDAILHGDGVTGTSEVKVVDRKYWILNLVPVVNDSATEEIGQAMGREGALRNVRIGEQYTFFNFAVAYCCSVVPIVNCIVMPTPVGSPRDFYFWGARIKPIPEGVPLPSADPAPADSGAAAATDAPGGY
jgi:hypothetical protein